MKIGMIDAFRLSLRLCLGWLLCVLVLWPDAAGAVQLASPDSFLEENRAEATALAEAEHVAAYYRVLDGGTLEEGDGRFMRIVFEFAVENTGDQMLHDLTLTVHLRESLQIALVSSVWYGMPHDLPSDNGQNKGHILIHTHEALLDLQAVCLLSPPLTMDDFYDLLVEVHWQNGQEVLRIAPEDCERPWLLPEEDPLPALNAERIRHINEESLRFLPK